MSDQESEKYYNSIGRQIAFNLTSVATWAVNAGFTTWTFSFYFSALKLDAWYIGLAFVIWTVWNAFNDPLIGYISDRTRTKIGRRKPYMIVGFIGVIIVEIILWVPPVRTDIGLFLYLMV